MAVNDLTAHQRQQAVSLAKRKSELATMQDRLLNAYVGGTIEEVINRANANETRSDIAKADEALVQLGDVATTRGDTALAMFDWSQRASDVWRGSNSAVLREILDAVCLNRTLIDVNLFTQRRESFDVLVKGLNCHNSRGDRRWTFSNDTAATRLLWVAIAQVEQFAAYRFYDVGR